MPPRANAEDVRGAFAWVGDSTNLKLRARRFTALQIAMFGPSIIDGATAIEDAAVARGVGRTSIYEMMATLRVRFHIVPPVSGTEPDFAPNGKQNGKPLFRSAAAKIESEADWDSPLENAENEENSGLPRDI